MTSIDFYVLAHQTQQDQMLFACRLLEKAAAQNHSILVHTHNEQQARAFDDLLWAYRPDAFIPHALLNAPDAPENCAISIGWQENPGHHHDVMINLSNTIPPFFSRFQRYVEIVVQHDAVLQSTRQHYQFLKDRGYPIKTTDMRMR